MTSIAERPECGTPSAGFAVPVACAVGLGLVMLDNTALTVVLPTITEERGASEAAARWIFVTFMLANLALLPAASGLSALLGRRGAYQTGLGVFATGSLVIALDGPFWLILVGRVLQGAGGALMLPNAAGLLEANLPRSVRSRGVATWVTVSSAGIFVGPVAAGLLSDALSWRLVFVAEVVIALTGLLLSRRLRDTVPVAGRRVDVPGMVLGGVGIGLASLAVLELGRPDPYLVLVLVAVVAAPVFLTLFLYVERRVAVPALDLAVFSTPGFGSLIGACLVYNAAVAGVGYVVSLSLQRDQHVSASSAGWFVFATMALLPVGSQLAGRLAARIGLGRLMALAAACLASAFGASALAFRVDIGVAVLPALAIGAAVGLLFAGDTVATMDLLTGDRLPSGLANLSISRQVGSVIGVAVLGTVHHYAGRVVAPGPEALAVTLSIAALAVVPAWWLLRTRVSQALTQGGAMTA